MHDILNAIQFIFAIAFILLLRSQNINSINATMRNHICWICSRNNNETVRYLSLHEEFFNCISGLKIEDPDFISEEEIPILKEILVYFQNHTAEKYFYNSYEKESRDRHDGRNNWSYLKERKKLSQLKHEEYFMYALHDFMIDCEENVLKLKEYELMKKNDLSGNDWRSYSTEAKSVKNKYEVVCEKIRHLCWTYKCRRQP